MPELLPLPVISWLEQQNFTLQGCQMLTGGCIARTELLTMQGRNGAVVNAVLKQMVEGSEAILRAEAEGLKVLRLDDPAALRVPEVYLQQDNCLLMEYLAPADRARDYDEQLARGLALQHRQDASAFGFTTDTYCGGTLQTNKWCDSGYLFFAEQRLMALGQRCFDKQLLSKTELKQLDALSQRLPDFVPDQPPVLIHGDLWSGNVLVASDGAPAIIDPAVWYGWAEAELAMTRMFGGFSAAFYQAYAEHSTILRDWQQRADLYNLYHYLNHLLLFGGSYHSDVVRIVKYYSG